MSDKWANQRAMETNRRVEDMFSVLDGYRWVVYMMEATIERLGEAKWLVERRLKEFGLRGSQVYEVVLYLVERLEKLKEFYEDGVEQRKLGELVSDVVRGVNGCWEEIDDIRYWVMNNKRELAERLDGFRERFEDFEKGLLELSHMVSCLLEDFRELKKDLSAR